MSKPALYPDTTPSGIALDPQSLERVIPESKRSDGSVRKEIKIRPGFTPQEDVGKFRSTKQKEMDARALPKGYIVGWTPASSAAKKTAGNTTGTTSKSQRKNEKRKEKKKADHERKIKESWEDDDEDEIKPAPEPKTKAATEISNEVDPTTDQVTEKLEKLKVNS